MSRLTNKDDRGRYYTVEEKILIANEPVNPTTTWIVHNENRRYGSPIEKLGKLEDLEEQLGCPLEVREKALNGFYITGYGYVSNDEDFIYLRKDNKGYYLKVVVHPSKPIPPDFYGYCDIHYLKDYKKTWFLKEDRSE